MSKSDWIVHPNRSEIGPDEPGRNGHFRVVARPEPEPMTVQCLARVHLPPELAEEASADGSVTFGDADWRFVLAAARIFARTHTEVEVPPPFGFKQDGLWWWWDGTTTEESILEGPDAVTYVEEYIQRLFPGMEFTVTEAR